MAAWHRSTLLAPYQAQRQRRIPVRHLEALRDPGCGD
jgi:hypothetical protein